MSSIWLLKGGVLAQMAGNTYDKLLGECTMHKPE